MLASLIKDVVEAAKPRTLCAACVAGKLDRRPTPVLRAIIGAFGLTSDFARYHGHCSSCGVQDWVIKAGGTT
jgi:hypothetical protein